MSKLEEVARAIAEEADPSTPWDECGQGFREICEGFARAAIEAMREPTDAMLPAEGVHIGFFNDSDGVEDNLYVDRDEARDVWRAMIDAALSEEAR